VPSPSRPILVVDDEQMINQAVSDRLAAEREDVVGAR
jgi:DNA-binding response OmpR family regulator